MSVLSRLAGILVIAFVSSLSASAWAQAEPPGDADGGAAPPTGALPPSAPTTEPAPAPAPSTPPPGGQYGGPPPNGQYAPYGAPPPPPDQGYAPVGGTYGEPPPPPEKPDEGFEMPPLSFRIDPFNWLLEGRLGVEAEVGILKFMSFEVVPVFVANQKPPTFNLSGADSTLRQKSNGIGAMSGAQFDVAFWLDGKALHGYVIRVGITDEGYTYRTENDAGAEIDSVSHTERRAFFMFGSHARWGAFTIAGGIGLGVELNKEERCFPNGATAVSQAKNSGCNNQLLIATDPTTQNTVDLNGPLHPMYLMGRFSLGVAFD